MPRSKLYRSVHILLFLFLLFAGLHFAKGFLLPITFGGLFATLLLPLTLKLERRGVNKGLSIFLCIVLLVIILGGIFWLIGWQLSGLTEEITTAKQQFNEIVTNIKQFIKDTLGISVREQEKIVEEQKTETGKAASKIVGGIFMGLTSFMANSVLILVYTFMFLYLRAHLKKFVLLLVPQERKKGALQVMKDSQEIGQRYIGGLARMIACICILYSIGFSILGIKHAILFALIGGTLEIIPYVGNLTAAVLTLMMAMIQGGSTEMIIGVICVYIIVQFVQGYILEPLIVGSEVNINPLFTIVALILGEAVWGIPGMILAIPTLGIVKILCDNIEPLKPYGFLLGAENTNGKSNFIQRLFKKREKS